MKRDPVLSGIREGLLHWSSEVVSKPLSDKLAELVQRLEQKECEESGGSD
jgi:hypothetical protein